VTADPWPGTLHGAHDSAGEHRLTENEVFGVVSFHKTLSGAAGGERP